MNIRGAVLMTLIALPACTTMPRAASQEMLDEQSGNTLLVVRRPLVFARERTDVAAHVRDYATLVAVEVDASGTYNDYLLLYRWSTVDKRMSAPPDPSEGKLRVLADGRVIDLPPLERAPVGVSRRRVMHLPEHGDATIHAYVIDVATLRFIAASREISLQLPQEPLPTWFKLWEDGRAALQQFSAAAGSQ
jgi:hypothetical protein